MVFVIDQEKCAKDGNCVKICPVDAIIKQPDGTFTVIDNECVDCSACEEECETGAIHSEQSK